jgi:hypothetical protein
MVKALCFRKIGQSDADGGGVGICLEEIRRTWFTFTIKASFVSTETIPIGMGKYNKKIMIVTIRDPDLFRVKTNLLMIGTPKGSESIH